MTAASVLRELKALTDPEDAAFLQRFFKTGRGEYAEGDQFLGIRVPVLRELARRYYDLPLAQVTTLLKSPLHEARLLALLLMIRLYDRGNEELRLRVFQAYLDLRSHINNWDLVDVSAPKIVGRHVYADGGVSARGRTLLTKLANADSMWDRRIAMIATQHFIRQGDFTETLRIAELLLEDEHDLIHKAAGWMLREVGNRDREAAAVFLRRHCAHMPRTMLRYAIEKLTPAERARYMKGATSEE